MINNKEYIHFLKLIISCVSNGDYYSIKELSNLELDKMCKLEKKNKKSTKHNKKIAKNKNIPLEQWEKEDIAILIEEYSNYVINTIDKGKTLEQLKAQLISIHEFIKIS